MELIAPSLFFNTESIMQLGIQLRNWKINICNLSAKSERKTKSELESDVNHIHGHCICSYRLLCVSEYDEIVVNWNDLPRIDEWKPNSNESWYKTYDALHTAYCCTNVCNSSKNYFKICTFLVESGNVSQPARLQVVFRLELLSTHHYYFHCRIVHIFGS